MPGMTELEIIAKLNARSLTITTPLIIGPHDADVARKAQGPCAMTALQEAVAARSIVRLGRLLYMLINSDFTSSPIDQMVADANRRYERLPARENVTS